MTVSRRILCLLFLLSGTALYNVAQAQLVSDYRLGIRGGLNLSTFYTPDIPEKNPRIGYHAGVFIELLLSEYFALQPELILSTRGSINTYSAAGASNTVAAEGEAEVFLVYLDLPLLAKARFGRIISVQAGPYLGFLLGTETFLEGDIEEEFSQEFDRRSFRSWDVGAMVGLGLDLNDVSIGFRYSRGFSVVGKGQAAKQLLGSGRNSMLQGYIAILL